jgi:hypothetical protein
MYAYRFPAFVILTSIFWTVELVSALLTWSVLSLYLSSSSKQPTVSERPSKVKNEDTDTDDTATISSPTKIKKEELEDYSSSSTAFLQGGDLSDTPRSFPAFSNQPPLRTPSTSVSSSSRAPSRSSEAEIAASSQIEPLVPSIDDDDVGPKGEYGAGGAGADSGIGTSVSGWSSSGSRSNVQRRSSHGPRGEE